jgi:hypothetical protein
MTVESDVPVNSKGYPIPQATAGSVARFLLLALALDTAAIILFLGPAQFIPVMIFWLLNALALPFWFVQCLRGVPFSPHQLVMWLATLPVSIFFGVVMWSNAACGMIQGVCAH